MLRADEIKKGDRVEFDYETDSWDNEERFPEHRGETFVVKNMGIIVSGKPYKRLVAIKSIDGFSTHTVYCGRLKKISKFIENIRKEHKV